MLPHTRNFTKTGCTVGARLVSYDKLCRSYVCNECGGRVVHHMKWNRQTQSTDHWAECGICGAHDFISRYLYEQQLAQFPIIVMFLPDRLRDLVEPARTVIDAQQAIDEMFDLPAEERAKRQERDLALPIEPRTRGRNKLFKT